MSDKAKCPYCGYENEIDNGEYNDLLFSETPFAYQCDECLKYFVVEPSVSVYLHTKEMQCQGEDHEWELSETYPRCGSKMVCIYCGETRDLTEEERKQYDVETVEEYVRRLNSKV